MGWKWPRRQLKKKEYNPWNTLKEKLGKEPDAGKIES